MDAMAYQYIDVNSLPRSLRGGMDIDRVQSGSSIISRSRIPFVSICEYCKSN